jgi:hypothetical protein
MLINVEDNDYEFIIRDICNADLYYLDKSDITLGQMEVFYRLANKL